MKLPRNVKRGMIIKVFIQRKMGQPSGISSLRCIFSSGKIFFSIPLINGYELGPRYITNDAGLARPAEYSMVTSMFISLMNSGLSSTLLSRFADEKLVRAISTAEKNWFLQAIHLRRWFISLLLSELSLRFSTSPSMNI